MLLGSFGHAEEAFLAWRLTLGKRRFDMKLDQGMQRTRTRRELITKGRWPLLHPGRMSARIRCATTYNIIRPREVPTLSF